MMSVLTMKWYDSNFLQYVVANWKDQNVFWHFLHNLKLRILVIKLDEPSNM